MGQMGLLSSGRQLVYTREGNSDTKPGTDNSGMTRLHLTVISLSLVFISHTREFVFIRIESASECVAVNYLFYFIGTINLHHFTPLFMFA